MLVSDNKSLYLIAQVEGLLFRVPRGAFEAQSAVFLDMFQIPSGNKAEEGSSDNNPVRLPAQVTRQAFRDLLEILYPG